MEDEGVVSSSPCLFTVQESWQQTPDARGYINSLLKRNKRTHFGIGIGGNNYCCE